MNTDKKIRIVKMMMFCLFGALTFLMEPFSVDGTSVMRKVGDLTEYRRPQFYRGSFNPLKAKVGRIDKESDFELKMKYQVHSVAFGVRVLKRLLDPIFSTLEEHSVSLEERFPLRVMPEEPTVGFFCETGFTDCVDFLTKEFEKYNLSARQDEPTSSIANQSSLCQEGSNYTFCSKEKSKIDAELKFSLLKKNITEDNPIIVVRHYKRLLTAMQFMCWYTMHKIYYLKYMLQCDSTSFNFVDNDPRADNKKPFYCAVYSFCPNPCNYKRRRSDPCMGEQQTGECSLNFAENTDFYALTERSMRVLCRCERGYTFDPSDGDNGACLENYIFKDLPHSCNLTSEDVLYYPDGAICECKDGYVLNSKNKMCDVDSDLYNRKSMYKELTWYQELIGKISNWGNDTFHAVVEYYKTIVPRLLQTEIVKFYARE